MAVNFPNSPTNNQTFTSSGRTYKYIAASATWQVVQGTTVTDYSNLTNTPTIPTDVSDLADSTSLLGSGGATVYANMAALVAASGMSSGDLALVTALNKLFMYTGSGWFLIATITNASPTAITGVAGTYTLASDGTATTITAVSTDPEGFPLTWSSSTSGLGSIATVSNVDNVFTITPSTDSSNAGTFSVTFSVTDGATGATSATAGFTLQFAIENSRYTSLLMSANAVGINNNITDNSSESPANNTAHSLTIAGNTSAGSFSPYRQGGYSVEFVSNAYLSLPSLSDFDMGTNPWTVNFWFYADTQSNNFPSIFSSINYGVAGSSSIRWDNHTRANKIFMYTNGVGDPAIVTTNTLSLNQWHYVTVTRENATDLKIYVNGTADASPVSYTHLTLPTTPYV